MAKRDMNDLLKRRMSATQQAAEVTVGDEAYEMLFQGKLASSASKFGSTSIVGVEKKQIISSSVGRIPGTAFMRGKTGCVF